MSYLCGLKTHRLLRMKPLTFTLLFLTALCLLSCTDRTLPPDTSDSVQVFPKTRYPFPAIKDIIDNSIELPEFPYYATFFDTIVPKLIEDTNFIEFILENRESYYDTTGNRHYLHSEKYIYCDTAKIRHNIYTDDVATSGFAEYGWVNGSLKLENPYKVFDCGKLSKENMIFLFIRIYDLESHIYYLFSFDKNYNFLSSICLYGYPVFDYDKFCETGELNEKKISNSFLNYSFDGSNLRLNIEDCNNNYIYYFFKIDEEGFFILHDIIHIYEEGGTHWKI